MTPTKPTPNPMPMPNRNQYSSLSDSLSLCSTPVTSGVGLLFALHVLGSGGPQSWLPIKLEASKLYSRVLFGISPNKLLYDNFK